MPHDACNTLHLPPVLTACCSKLEVLNLDVGEAEDVLFSKSIRIDSQYCECQRIHVNSPPARPPPACLPACPHITRSSDASTPACPPARMHTTQRVRCRVTDCIRGRLL